ncbi:SAM-dependent methyltransferase [Nocardioides daedukensis]|uniref:SAM-dependent methyltransferase n=1 Tax=Nocardioides daedukensis TaxID=634462 RepID=A0A7Y9RWE6_9ACTN|nr:class I SAM-dependent methyltransferase [Nocardioides daedukensis]NYG57907.1 SAM-dependent methyltransferase [Nocardioides daedukensis]
MTGQEAPDNDDVEAIYRNRFSERDLANKRILWAELVAGFFQRFIPLDATVVDLGAGNCEFINSVSAKRRLAVDLNPDCTKHADSGVEVLTTRSDKMTELADGSVDTIFTSNFFEHLQTKGDLMSTLHECRRVTSPGGLIIVMMPNIRWLPGRYWDYLDHHLPLTDVSMAEALELSGYEVVEQIGRFLPYTVKDARFEVRPFMIRAYLSVPFVWRFLGKQMLVVGRRRQSDSTAMGV